MPKSLSNHGVIAANQRGITFQVDDVVPAATPLRCIPVKTKLGRLSGEMVIHGSIDGDVINGHSVHSLLETIHSSYVDHRPLILTPDHIWLTLCQGLAHHIQAQPEMVRERVVLHEGRRGVAAFFSSADVDWVQVLEELGAEIATEAPELHSLVMQNFSTTGEAERMAYLGVLLEMAGSYFGYNINPICGIPSITLRGEASDWDMLIAAASALRRFGLGFWIDRIELVLRHFAMAARGDVDVAHWQRIYQQNQRCSVTFVSGWIGLLFPYIKNGRNHRCDVRNPLLSDQPPSEGVSHPLFPVGVSKVHLCERSGMAPARGFVSGFIGTTQHIDSFSLEPRIGWGVFSQRDPLPVLRRLRPFLSALPVSDEIISSAIVDEHLDMPYDLQALYRLGNGGSIPVGLFGSLEIKRFDELASIRSKSDTDGYEHLQPIPVHESPRFRFDLIHFGTFHDGSHLCWAQRAGGPEIIFVWLLRDGREAIIAVTLGELVECLLDKSATSNDLLSCLRIRKSWPF